MDRLRGAGHIGESGHETLLRRVTEALIGTLDPEQAAARLAELVVPGLADWAVVTLLDESHRGTRHGLRHAGAGHRDAELQPLAERYARTRLPAFEEDALPLRALRCGEPAFLTGGATGELQSMLRAGPARELIDVLAPEHLAILPLPGRHGPVGLLSLHNDACRGSFTGRELATAADVATRAGVVLDTARLYHQQRALAEVLQRSLLTPPPPVDGLRIAVRYLPATQTAEIGGDWYDVFTRGERATVVIGDVTGHDSNAAAEMGQLRTLLRGIAVATGTAPSPLLGAVDAAMTDLRVTTLATAVVGDLAPHPAAGSDRWRLRWTNAGHPPPLLASADGRVTVLRSGPGRLLGLGAGPARSQPETTLAPGDLVLLYTDGLIEHRGRGRDGGIDEGIARLGHALADLLAHRRGAAGDVDLDDLCDRLLAHVLPDRSDDVALLAVQALR